MAKIARRPGSRPRQKRHVIDFYESDWSMHLTVSQATGTEIEKRN